MWLSSLALSAFFIVGVNSFISQFQNTQHANKIKKVDAVDNTKLHASVNSAAFDLVVWDCDGVLVDSEALLKQGEVEALSKAGFTVTIDDCVRLFSGFSPDAATANFLKEMGRPLPVDFFKEQVEGSLQLFRDRLEPLMKDTVIQLHEIDQVRMCVASGSPRNRVDISLVKGGIGHCFPPTAVFTREEVKRGKPAPDLFLHAAEKMGVKPSKCVVVEDSAAGIEAAIAADMKVIGYLGGGHAIAKWYRDKIFSYNIPIGYTQKDIYNLLKKDVVG